MRGLAFILPFTLAAEAAFAAEPKVISHSIRRHNRQPNISARTRRKRDVAVVSLYNNVPLTLYEVNITVGTPPQDITLDIDTGSSDIWMFSDGLYTRCDGFCVGGSYEASDSTTFQQSDAEFEIQYADGAAAEGYYFQDAVHIGNVSVSEVTLALAEALYEWELISPGVMGVGMDANEASEEEYAGFLDDLVKQGQIKSHSFSLWLDDLEASTGTILFGGYDGGKVDGDLTVLEIQENPDNGKINSYYIAFTSLTFTHATKSTVLSAPGLSAGLPVLLDSGTSLTYIPTAMYEELANYFRAYPDRTTGEVLVPCDLGVGTLDFGFGGSSSAVVKVPFSELAIPAWNSSETPPTRITLKGGAQACAFGLQPAEAEDEIVFGDTFLRSAYVVYQLDNNLIGLGQSNFNSTKSNIVEIPSGDDPFGTIGVTASAATVSATAHSSASTKPGHMSHAASTAIATSSGNGAAITGSTTSEAGATYTTGSASAASASATSTGKSGASAQHAGIGLAAVAGVAAFAL